MSWQFVEYEGRLALTLGWSPHSEKPIEERRLWVHLTEKWDEWYYQQFTQIESEGGNQMRCFSNRTWGWAPMNVNGWQQVNEELPLKPPGRGGKDWHWVYSGYGRWRKEYL